MWRGKRSGSSESCSSPRTARWAGWEVCSVTQGGGFPEPLRPPGSVAYSPGMKSQIGHRCPSSLPFLPERGSDGKYWERDGERRSAWPGLAQEGCGGLMEGALDSLKEAETWLALIGTSNSRSVLCTGASARWVFQWDRPTFQPSHQLPLAFQVTWHPASLLLVARSLQNTRHSGVGGQLGL